MICMWLLWAGGTDDGLETIGSPFKLSKSLWTEEVEGDDGGRSGSTLEVLCGRGGVPQLPLLPSDRWSLLRSKLNLEDRCPFRGCHTGGSVMMSMLLLPGGVGGGGEEYRGLWGSLRGVRIRDERGKLSPAVPRGLPACFCNCCVKLSDCWEQLTGFSSMIRWEDDRGVEEDVKLLLDLPLCKIIINNSR